MFVVMMSTEQRKKSFARNKYDADEFAGFLRKEKFQFHIGVGKYNGWTEESFMIRACCEDDVETLLNKSVEYHQECIMVCDKGGENPRFVSKEGIQLLDGRVETSPERPEGDFTRIGDLYYSIK